MYKLVAFDMDGTIVDAKDHSWQIFHDHFRVDPKVREDIMYQFFNNKITYQQWAEKDVNIWKQKGIKKKDFIIALEKYSPNLMEGSIELFKKLKKERILVALISGGVDVLIDYLIPGYQELFCDVYINRMIFDDEQNLIGIDATEFDLERKADAMQHLASKFRVPLDNCAYIGDHYNDISAVKSAGLGIAFNSKVEDLKNAADAVVNSKNLMDVLDYICYERKKRY